MAENKNPTAQLLQVSLLVGTYYIQSGYDITLYYNCVHTSKRGPYGFPSRPMQYKGAALVVSFISFLIR